MSRTDLLAAGDPARPATSFHDKVTATAAPAVMAIPHDALALLPALHREAGRDLELLGLLAASPRLCLVLMVEATVVLAWSGMDAGVTLAARFGWAAALSLGIAAVARNHIRGFARTPRLTTLAQAARELRALLLYLALAWGLGAFLVLPPACPPLAVFTFMTAPILAGLLVLRCEKSLLALGLPASLLTAAALWWRGQPLGAGALAGVSIAAIAMLHCAIRRRSLRH